MVNHQDIKEMKISFQLPYSYCDEDGIITNHNGDQMIMIQLGGMPYQTAPTELLEHQKQRRAYLFQQLSDQQLALYTHAIRTDMPMSFGTVPAHPIAGELVRDYYRHLEHQKNYQTQYYLTLIARRPQRGRALSCVRQLLARSSYTKHIEINHERDLLQQQADHVASYFKDYGARICRTFTTDGQHFNEAASILSQLLSSQAIRLASNVWSLPSLLPRESIHFENSGQIVFEQGMDKEKEYGAILSIKQYPTATCTGILDQLMTVPAIFVVTQSFVPCPAIDMRESLEWQIRRLERSEDPDKVGLEALKKTLGDVTAKEAAYGYHHFSLFVRNKTKEALKRSVALVQNALEEVGIPTVVERYYAEGAFWSQMPGNFRFIVRKQPISNYHLAGLNGFHLDERGFAEENHWGESLALLKTSADVPYHFNFHQHGTDRGHSLVVGSTGSGKTLLISFLLAMSAKYGAALFYFDKDRGAEILMRAMGADPVLIGHDHGCHLNPLQLPDSQQNREYLKGWLILLAQSTGERLTGKQIEKIADAIEVNYRVLDRSQRRLSNLLPLFNTEVAEDLNERLKAWCRDGLYAHYFDHVDDQLRFQNKYHHFEMGPLLKSGEPYSQAVPSILSYLFHRIDMAIDGSPAIICLDEAWKLLANPQFEKELSDWLRTFRKKNVIVVLLTQSIDELKSSAIGELIRNMTATKLIFANHEMDGGAYREFFQLTERELTLLKESLNERDRHFLIKKSNESVLARLDLEGLQKWMPVLSSNSHSLSILDAYLRSGQDLDGGWIDSLSEATRVVQ